MDKESFSFGKVSWYGSVIKGKFKTRLGYKLEKFSDFNIEEAQKYFSEKIMGVLIDIDDCTAPAYGDIVEENKEKIRQLIDSGIKVGILSNGINIQQRAKELLDMGAILCETTKSKPDIMSFIEACGMIGVDPNNTLMIGDDISKDGGALQDNGENSMLGYVPVKPIGNSMKNIPNGKKINYFFKKVSRWFANKRNGL